jgi:hypothetical protein
VSHVFGCKFSNDIFCTTVVLKPTYLTTFRLIWIWLMALKRSMIANWLFLSYNEKLLIIFRVKNSLETNINELLKLFCQHIIPCVKLYKMHGTNVMIDNFFYDLPILYCTCILFMKNNCFYCDQNNYFLRWLIKK